MSPSCINFVIELIYSLVAITIKVPLTGYDEIFRHVNIVTSTYAGKYSPVKRITI